MWALAVRGSAQRTAGELAGGRAATFAAAFAKARQGAFGWARGELERRFAHHLLPAGNRRALELVNAAMASFAEHPDQLAESFNLRGVCRSVLRH